MDRFNALGRGMQIMLVAGVLLLIDTFFAWQKVTVTVLGVEASSSANAWHGFWGVVMGLLTIILVAWLIARLAAVDIPLPVSSAMVSATIAILIFLFALIKNLADDYSTFWSYLGVVLAGLVAVGAWLQVQESGGIETLKTEATSMRPQSTATASPPSEPAAQAPPPQPTTPTPPSAPSETAPPATTPPPPPEQSPPSSEPTS